MNGPSDGAFHHRFEDAEKWAKEFDNPERDAWQKPEEILDALHLQRTSLVADIGAGTGYFSVRIARRIPEGKIFAADTEPNVVRYLGERARPEHLITAVPLAFSPQPGNLATFGAIPSGAIRRSGEPHIEAIMRKFVPPRDKNESIETHHHHGPPGTM